RARDALLRRLLADPQPRGRALDRQRLEVDQRQHLAFVRLEQRECELERRGALAGLDRAEAASGRQRARQTLRRRGVEARLAVARALGVRREQPQRRAPQVRAQRGRIRELRRLAHVEQADDALLREVARRQVGREPGRAAPVQALAQDRDLDAQQLVERPAVAVLLPAAQAARRRIAVVEFA